MSHPASSTAETTGINTIGPHRQRVLDALRHRQPDRIPLDLGSTIVTGIAISSYQNLLSHLGIRPGAIDFFDLEAQLALVDTTILERFQIDTAGVKPGTPKNPSDVSPGEDLSQPDAWGVRRKFSHETHTWFVVEGPLSGSISRQDVLNHPFPDPENPQWFQGIGDTIASIRAARDCAILLSLPTNFILKSIEMRGYEDWLMDSAQDQPLLEVLLDSIQEVQLEVCRSILEAFGDQVDIVVNFDDLAIQDRLLVSPRVYNKLLEPRLKKLYALIHSKTPAKVLHHTDGAIRPLLPSLIDMGVDAINPVQISAVGMDDLSALKKDFGKHLTFWGGIDTQDLLPQGTVNDVRGSVVKTLETLNRDGGYVLCAVHNIQPDVPPENIVAMYDTALGLLL